MPELPDVVVYIDALTRHYQGEVLEDVEVRSPFVIRSLQPDLHAGRGRHVEAFWRLGKRIVWQLEDELLLVFHLMIAGRFHQRKPRARPRSKSDLIAFHFPKSTLMLTEASSKKRASLHVLAEIGQLADHTRAGLEVLSCDLPAFAARMRSENHTLKRALTDPRLCSGIGNAYSDEILHAARLSPVAWTSRLDDEQIERLYHATQRTLLGWIERLREETGDGFPEKVTAFRPGMAVHGRYGQLCPVCGSKVQRIRYAENETNYCPVCQTGGRLLKDRSLSRLLKDDWPRTVESLEQPPDAKT